MFSNFIMQDLTIQNQTTKIPEYIPHTHLSSYLVASYTKYQYFNLEII